MPKPGIKEILTICDELKKEGKDPYQDTVLAKAIFKKHGRKPDVLAVSEALKNWSKKQTPIPETLIGKSQNLIEEIYAEAKRVAEIDYKAELHEMRVKMDYLKKEMMVLDKENITLKKEKMTAINEIKRAFDKHLS